MKNVAFESFLTHARAEILKEFRPDSCIASTRIGMEVLDHFGIPSEPLPVRTTIYNPAYVERIKAGHSGPRTEEELAVWVNDYNVWNVGLGHGGDPLPGKWPGHLTILVDKRIVVDLSLDQATRLQQNIKLQTCAFEIDQEFLNGNPLNVELNGCNVQYVAAKGNLGYTKSPDWSIASRRIRIVSNIIQLIKRDLA